MIYQDSAQQPGHISPLKTQLMYHTCTFWDVSQLLKPFINVFSPCDPNGPSLSLSISLADGEAPNVSLHARRKVILQNSGFLAVIQAQKAKKKHPKLIKMKQPEELKGRRGWSGGGQFATLKFPEVGMLCSRTSEI